MIKNQKGFTAFEGILIALVIVAIGAAGYFAYQARQDQTDYSVNTSNKKVDTQPSKDESKYFTVKEWGVKFKLVPGYEDLYYKIVNRSDGSGAYFSTRSIDALSPQCAADKTSQAAIGLYVDADNLPQVETVVLKDGERTFTSSLGNGICFDPDDISTSEKVMKFREDFKNMTSSLVVK